MPGYEIRFLYRPYMQGICISLSITYADLDLTYAVVLQGLCRNRQISPLHSLIGLAHILRNLNYSL